MFVLLLILITGFKPGDAVFIKIWNHPELTDTFYVEEDTTIEFPLIGVIDVSRLTPRDLQDTLKGKYSLYIQNPYVRLKTLIRVSILGEVKKPGIYYINETDEFLDVLALAGGPTDDANLKKAILRRGHYVYKVDLKEAIETGRKISELGVRSGDIIFIPKKASISWRDVYYIVSTIALFWTIYRTLRG